MNDKVFCTYVSKSHRTPGAAPSFLDLKMFSPRTTPLLDHRFARCLMMAFAVYQVGRVMYCLPKKIFRFSCSLCTRSHNLRSEAGNCARKTSLSLRVRAIPESNPTAAEFECLWYSDQFFLLAVGIGNRCCCWQSDAALSAARSSTKPCRLNQHVLPNITARLRQLSTSIITPKAHLYELV